MKYCPDCGAPIAEDSKFCESCGKPIANTQTKFSGSGTSYAPESKGEFTLGSWEDDDAPTTTRQENIKPSRNPKKSKPSKKESSSGGFLKNMGKGLIAVILPVILSALGYGGYTYFINNDVAEKPTPRYEQPIEQPEEVLTDQPVQQNDEQMTADSDLVGIEDLDGIVSVSDEEAEQQLKNIEQRSNNRYENSYTGTWKSVGVLSMKYKDIKDLSNLHKATYIDMNMNEAENIGLTFGNGHMKLVINGKTSLEGSYTISPTGDVKLQTSSGEVGNFWMYSDLEGELYCYIYYVEKDGTEMASGIKLKRISKNV